MIAAMTSGTTPTPRPTRSTIRDSRTGKSYTIPIADGAIRAMDLRQIRVDDDDFGLMTLRSGVHEHRVVPQRDHLHRRRQGNSALSRLSRSSSSPRGDVPRGRVAAAPRRAADAGRSTTSGCTTSRIHTYVHENIKRFLEGFRYDAHPMSMLCSSVAALVVVLSGSEEHPRPSSSATSRSSGCSRSCRRSRRSATATSKGLPFVYPDNDLSYVENFLSMVARMTRVEVRGESGVREGARGPVHPARRSRAELLDERGARGRLVARRSVLARSRRASRRCTVRCTAAPTSRCCA